MAIYKNAITVKLPNRRVMVCKYLDGIIIEFRTKDNNPSNRAVESNRLGMHQMGFKLSMIAAMALCDSLNEYFHKTKDDER